MFPVELGKNHPRFSFSSKQGPDTSKKRCNADASLYINMALRILKTKNLNMQGSVCKGQGK